MDQQSVENRYKHKSELVIALEQSKSFSEAILNSLPDNIAVLDRKGEILRVNEKWLSFYRANSQSADSKAIVGLNYFTQCEKVINDSSAKASDREVSRNVLQAERGRDNLEMLLDGLLHNYFMHDFRRKTRMQKTSIRE